MTDQSGNDAHESENAGASGNRWEPTGPPDRPSSAADETAEQPTMAQPVQQPEQPTEPAPRRSRRDVLRRRVPVAAVGAVFLLGGGVAGYALGHATADDGGGVGRHSFDDGGQAGPGDGFGPGWHDQWQQPPGQQGEDGPGFGQGGPPGDDDGGPGGQAPQESDDNGTNGQDTSGTPS